MEIVEGLLDQVLQYLPGSPFQSFLKGMGNLPYLKYLNYFIPIQQMIAIGEAWLVAILLYYAYVIVLRWIKAID